MKLGNKLRKIVPLLLAMIMIMAALAACSKGNNDSSSSTPPVSSKAAEESKEPTESKAAEVSQEPIQIGMLARYPFATAGVQTDNVTKEIEKKTGITIDVINTDDEKMKVLLASGDLPDLLFINRQYVDPLLKGDMVMPLDDLIEQYGADIKKNAQPMLNFSKEFISNGTGKTFFLGANVGPATKWYNYERNSFNIRWDYYKELGYPAINNYEDMLNVLKQMQTKHPTTDEGKKVYGLGGFTDAWTNRGIWWVNVLGVEFDPNGAHPGIEGYMELNTDTQVTHMLAKEDSAFWLGMKIANKAHRMGLLDPETFTQKHSNMTDKGNNAQYLASVASFQNSPNQYFIDKGQPEKGFNPIPPTTGHQLNGFYSKVGSTNKMFAISKNAKNPERIMQLINYFYTEEFSRMSYSGIKDKDWVVKDGVPVLTEEFVEAQAKDLLAFQATVGAGKWNHYTGLNAAFIGQDGEPMQLRSAKERNFESLTPLQKDYVDHYQVKYPGEVVDKMVESGKVKLIYLDDATQLAVGIAPDDIQRKDKAIQDYLMKIYAKIIMAKTDDAFEAEKKAAMDEMRKLGLDESVAYWTDAWKKSLEKYNAATSK